MGSVRALAAVYLGVSISLFIVICQSQAPSENKLSSQEDKYQMGYFSKDLVEALEGLVDGNKDNRISLEKKASLIPWCDVGERCAMKHGPRIGRLCDCLRGTACNTFFLRCY
ncbi:cocaine- and amphetamine-regulated transcript 4 [Paramormyrops kingsleyae]|uniref:Cocaine- and amphetamine-regulated transcript 4 n=1 Tax=Paramormyrops kingsleyae TaxID=1676925 RepID=A0A3B3QW11_9TELE|nr:cocaine- and amphetamine-regulated transcript protein-like [Paramormyrops kingsleyae]